MQPGRPEGRPLHSSAVFRHRRLDRTRDDARELAALQELAAFAAAAGDFVLPGADRLFGAARRFNGHQITIAGRRDEAKQAIVLLLQLDEDNAAAGSGEEVD